MYKDLKIAVVIPCYNVEKHIRAVVKGIPPFVDKIIAVNDASTDQTAKALEDINDPRLTILYHSMNQGVGGAALTGFQQALRDGSDILVKMDGDEQMDPFYLPALLTPLVEGFSYAKGNRFLHSTELNQMPLLRKWGNFWLTFLTKITSGYWHIFDPQNGYWAIKAGDFSVLDLSKIHRRFFFENDMLVQLNIFNLKIKDVPIPARYGNEKSSMKLYKIVLSFPFFLINRLIYRFYQKYILRDFSPIAIFVMAGLPLFFWGLGFGLYAWWKSITTNSVATTGTVMLSVLPFLIGFELLLQGIILDINETPR
ncbi:MAG: glycosyltransferase family 2 protein [Nitrospirae bacterium]|nr:glycosyltransferase family 2 protein [Nitrospirota bacterium]MBI3353084.1 glycosyltransferase family 2 protein [Nitrospirota bacterium]